MMMGKRETVYERAKKNGGYMDGGNNRLVQNMAKPEPEESEESSGPPNYRDAYAQMGSCARCSSYSKGQCDKHGQEVDADSVCDDFSRVGEQAESDVEPEEEEEIEAA